MEHIERDILTFLNKKHLEKLKLHTCKKFTFLFSSPVDIVTGNLAYNCSSINFCITQNFLKRKLQKNSGIKGICLKRYWTLPEFAGRLWNLA